MRIINRHPGGSAATLVTAVAPFVVLVIVYAIVSDMRLSENPDDKLLPGLASFADAIQRSTLRCASA